MYRTGEEYDKVDKVINDIYFDYDIKEFPIDETEICQKLGVCLMPYSLYDRDDFSFLIRKRSGVGFFVKESIETPPTIYYNDCLQQENASRFTVFHEIKHYVYNDDDDSDDDLADYFARQFMCPTPYFLLLGADSAEELIDKCGLSFTAACNALSKISNRREKYGDALFDYEVPLIEHLDSVLLETRNIDIIRK